MHGNIETAFIGRLGSDPTLRHVKDGTLALLSFTAAVGDDDEVQWVRVAAFGDQAESLEGKLAKGGKIYVEGKLKLDTFTDKQGEQRSMLNVTAWTLQPLGNIGRRKPKRSTTKPAAAAEGTPFDDPIGF